MIETNERYLCGELRCDHPQPLKYHIYEQDSGFTWEKDGAYRHNIVRRKAINKASGEVAFDQELIVNHAKVMYDPRADRPCIIPRIRLLESSKISRKNAFQENYA